MSQGFLRDFLSPQNRTELNHLEPYSLDQFLILSRSRDLVSPALYRNLSSLGTVEVIVDEPGDSCKGMKVIWILDEEAEGFEFLMSNTERFPAVTAWSLAFVHLARTLKEGAAEGFFEEPWRSFNPLCRLSGRLVREILDFREARRRFTFHEVFFASVAKAHGMRCFDWGKDAELKYDVAHFRYRPVIESALPGIVHPVKDLGLVNLLCEAPKREFRRMGAANLSGYSILAEDYVFLSRFCREFGIEKVVEFGPGASVSKSPD